MRRGISILLAAIALLLIVAISLYWHLATGRLETGFRVWQAQARAAGWTVTAGTTKAGGWPLTALLQVDGLSIEGGEPDIPGGFAWTAQQAQLHVSLLAPRSLLIDARGPQTLRLGHGPVVPYAAERLALDVPLTAGDPPSSVGIQADNLHAQTRADSPAAGSLTIGSLRGHAEIRLDAPQGETAIGFSLSAEAVGLPTDVRWPLGPQMSSVSLEGALEGPVPQTPGLTARATGWRDGGGSLEIQHLAVGWGPLGLSGSATIALDDQLQPMGAGTSRLVGYAAALDALAANGALTRSAATAAKAVLSLLASTPGDNEPSAVDVPLTLQYRTLSMRQVPLVRFPELDWPSQ
jgi:hypothetical protein